MARKSFFIFCEDIRRIRKLCAAGLPLQIIVEDDHHSGNAQAKHKQVERITERRKVHADEQGKENKGER